jgi:ADP-heptose:LPS heptosyltransferase
MPRRALVVRIGALGDVLLTRRLSYSLSLAGFRTTLLAPSRHASLLLEDPWIEGILDSEAPRFASAFAGVWPEAKGCFDLAVVISGSVGLTLAARSAATQVIEVEAEPRGTSMSIARQWAEGAGAACAAFSGALPLLGAGGAARVAGASLIHAGSGSPRKNWPIERFVELSHRLKTSGRRIAWVLGPAEADFDEGVFRDDLIVRAPLQELAATLARSRLFVGNDSGVSHLAAALGTPTVAIFGPTDPVVWGGDGPRVRTVRGPGGALLDLPVDAVKAAIDDVTRLEPS